MGAPARAARCRRPVGARSARGRIVFTRTIFRRLAPGTWRVAFEFCGPHPGTYPARSRHFRKSHESGAGEFGAQRRALPRDGVEMRNSESRIQESEYGRVSFILN